MRPQHFLWIGILMLFSCEQMKLKKIDKTEAIENELSQFSFNEVDVFPSFESCQTDEEPQATQACFVETLHQKLNPFFENRFGTEDTLHLSIHISEKGQLAVKKIHSLYKKETQDALQDSLNLFIHNYLPKVHPAQKQGIPVQCNMVLPVIIVSKS